MRGLVFLAISLSVTAIALSCGGEPEEDVAETIIAMERAALDRWGNGDPWGFIEISAPEVTYFDTGTERRVDGLEALRELYAPREGQISIDHYDMINPKVQVHGDTAVLTFNLIDYIQTPEGASPEVRWNCTEVYCRINGEWKIVHTHWSRIRPLAQEEEVEEIP